MRVAGPLAYLDTWTVDGRMLLSDATLELAQPIAICIPYSWDKNEDARVVGYIDLVERCGNVLWGSGEANVPFSTLPRPVSFEVTDVKIEADEEADRIVIRGWRPAGVVLSEVPNRVWAAGETLLEEE